MNNEIKEILAKLEILNEEYDYIKGFIIPSEYFKILKVYITNLENKIDDLEDTIVDKCECIEAYNEIIYNKNEIIINLQEQLHKASLDIQELTERDIWCSSNCDKLTNLQKENIKLISENETIKNIKYMVDETIYKSRIDKAIEYIKNHREVVDEKNEKILYWLTDDFDEEDLLNILKGEDNE